MRNIEKLFLMAAIFVAMFSQSVSGQETIEIVTGSLEIQVKTVESGSSFPAYVGSGLATASAFSTGRGMSALMMVKDDDGTVHTYMAGKITSSKGSILVMAKLEVKNVSGTVQSIRLGDIQMKSDKEQTDFVAVGFGSYAFAKDKSARDKVKNETNNIEPNDSRRLIYIFAVPTEAKSWKLTYKGNKEIELKGKDNKSK